MRERRGGGWAILGAALALLLSSGDLAAADSASFPFQVARSYPHDREAFTQGLAYDAGFLYEGTGLYGRSSLRKVELASGRVLKEVRLAPSHFGEGISLFGERIVQLTWQSRIGFVYDKASFRLLGSFPYAHEGWGITQDGKRFIVSDGTEVLRFWDPVRFGELGLLRVRDGQGPVTGLNELEYVDGLIYANQWPTNRIVAIDPRTGRVRARFTLPGLLSQAEAAGADVANGMAYDPESSRFWITGKFWPRLFELRQRP